MRTLLLSCFLIITIFTMNYSWAQNLPPSSSIQVKVLSSYSYKALDGTTIVQGEIQNQLDSPVNNVTIGITFMNDNYNPIEYKTGKTLLQVIPPGGKIPFSISSTSPDPSITQVQVKLGGFRSSSDRPQALEISPNSLQVSDKLVISGNITNHGSQKSLNTRLYLISYDAFQRVVGIGISNPIDIDAGKNSHFSITSDSSSRAKSFAIISESDNYQSKSTPVTSVHVTLPVFVSDTVVTDINGKSFSTIPLNADVKITSNANYLLNSTQTYSFYVQVKQFNGQVSFIAKSEGIFLGSGDQNISVNWKPHSPGSYFIETYVWDYDSVPLSPAVPSINVVLVK